MKKWCVWAALLLAALLLSGCGASSPDDAEGAGAPGDAVSTPLPTAEVKGEMADKVRALLSPYEGALQQAARDNPDSLACTIPEDVLMQMARDAAALNAAASGGRYVFSWQSRVESTYVATMDDAQEEMDILLPGVTPDPANDAPIDSQQFGDYSVNGGGLYERTRSWDMAENLISGSGEITELLNDTLTGHELFSFALRGNELYFVDATLDVVTDLDELLIREGYLVTAGVLRANGLEIIEYHVGSQSQIPDPAAMSLAQLLSSVTPDNRIIVTVR